jgi:hypothetical protein
MAYTALQINIAVNFADVPTCSQLPHVDAGTLADSGSTLRGSLSL